MFKKPHSIHHSADQTTSRPLQPHPYLCHRFQQTPYPSSLNQQLLTQHFLWEEWKREKDGGLICKDNRPIEEQKKVFKHIVMMMGKNLLQNKGLLNVSLPVTVFRTESHLQSIARNFSFAPILLEKAVSLDPLEKVKHALLFALSVSALSISVNKPFNPILGETLQVWIDGCPMYVEQISHHPPIAAYYFVGRGYKLYGKIGSKAKFGFNVIYGFSDEPNIVAFDDGTEIQINFARMAIKGFLFGDREFNFTQKMFAYDKKNSIFASLKFGERDTGFFSSSNEPTDFLFGKVYQVTKNYKKEFMLHSQNSEIKHPSKKHILKELCNFEGLWDGKVKFNGVEYVDFTTQNPCIVKQEVHPLQSNSTYREDVCQLLKGDRQAAQASKEQLEDRQRKDRKLREKAKHK